jgi:hypothetical protein
VSNEREVQLNNEISGGSGCGKIIARESVHSRNSGGREQAASGSDRLNIGCLPCQLENSESIDESVPVLLIGKRTRIIFSKDAVTMACEQIVSRVSERLGQDRQEGP